MRLPQIREEVEKQLMQTLQFANTYYHPFSYHQKADIKHTVATLLQEEHMLARQQRTINQKEVTIMS